MCGDLTVEDALKRVAAGLAGQVEADLLRGQIDQLVFILQGLGIDASCVFDMESVDHGG